jgi:hypothetical protein
MTHRCECGCGCENMVEDDKQGCCEYCNDGYCGEFCVTKNGWCYEPYHCKSCVFNPDSEEATEK